MDWLAEGILLAGALYMTVVSGSPVILIVWLLFFVLSIAFNSDPHRPDATLLGSLLADMRRGMRVVGACVLYRLFGVVAFLIILGVIILWNML